MPENDTPTPAAPTIKLRQSAAAQRRAAESRLGAGRQAELKQEAADRRAARALREADAGPQVVASNPSRRPRPR